MTLGNSSLMARISFGRKKVFFLKSIFSFMNEFSRIEIKKSSSKSWRRQQQQNILWWLNLRSSNHSLSLANFINEKSLPRRQNWNHCQILWRAGLFMPSSPRKLIVKWFVNFGFRGHTQIDGKELKTPISNLSLFIRCQRAFKESVIVRKRLF